MADTVNWGEVDKFPEVAVNDFKLYTEPAADGEEDKLQCRIAASFTRQVDEIIQHAKAQGLPMRTRSDFLRFSAINGLETLTNFLRVHDEELTHYLFLMRQAQKSARTTAMLVDVRTQITQLTGGLEVLTHETRQDWDEAKNRLIEFLSPVQEMAGISDFLMKMYTRELFGHKPFQRIVERLRDNIELGPIIGNFERAYSNIKQEK